MWWAEVTNAVPGLNTGMLERDAACQQHRLIYDFNVVHQVAPHAYAICR
jgi:hypothetical protein